MSRPDRAVGAGDAGGVAEARPDRRQAPGRGLARACSRPARRAGWRARAAGARRTPSAGRACPASIAVGRAPIARQQPVQALVQDARGAARAPASGTRSRRRTDPRARAPRPRVSAPASGWPPMKRSSAAGVGEHALGRADVADHAVRRGASKRHAHRLRERAHRRGDEHDVGVRARPRRVARAAVDRAELERRARSTRSSGS